jgi:hypothetical protein
MAGERGGKKRQKTLLENPKEKLNQSPTKFNYRNDEESVEIMTNPH